MNSCADRKEQLAASDFYKVGKIYAETSAASFQKGELARGLSTGMFINMHWFIQIG